MKSVHQPVMLNEVIEYLNLHLGDNVVDCTFGGGGHSKRILEKILPNGKLLAIDANQDVKKIKDNKNFKLIIDNFKNLKKIVKQNKEFLTTPAHFTRYPSLKSRGIKIDGILLDLGLSSDELEKSNRGFSFQKDEPLDMRFNVQQNLTAAEILNTYSLENLYDIFKNFGDYPHARRLSQSIFNQHGLKKFKTTQDLVDLILEINPRKHYHKLHPATKPFQALRIAVNNELENLEKVLPQAIEVLAPSGRLIVISFHALEDKIVKHYLRNLSREENPKIKLLTKKPLVPSEQEKKENPRSRSAKMRVVEKIL